MIIQKLGIYLGLSFCSLNAIAMEHLHQLIPAGPGGGLDGTARESGRILSLLRAYETISYENLPGGGGGRALGQFIESSSRYRNATIINSTPLIVRSLQGLFPYSYKDLEPIAGLVADYGIFVVRENDPIKDWKSLEKAFTDNPKSIITGGGSVRGSLDHIVLTLALEPIKVDPRDIRYLPYDGGAKAMLSLLGGEIRLLSSGVGETVPFLTGGKVRAIAVSAPKRIGIIPDVPTLTELGREVVFANWRGIFANKNVSDINRKILLDSYAELKQSDAWEKVIDQRGWQTLNVQGQKFAAYLENQEKMLDSTLRGLGFIKEQ